MLTTLGFNRSLFAIVLLAFVLAVPLQASATYVTFHVGGSGWTCAYGASNGKVVGSYTLGGIDYGFLNSGGVNSSLWEPNAGAETIAWGVSGNNVVGVCDSMDDSLEHAFLYHFDTNTWQILSNPWNNDSTLAFGVSGNQVVGSYIAKDGTTLGFLYNAAADTWTSTKMTLDAAKVTAPHGISADGTVVGGYSTDMNAYHGFIKQPGDIGSYQTIDYPGAYFTEATGISGNYVVGFYRQDLGSLFQGFIYNRTTRVWQSVSGPAGTNNCFLWGIDGSRIVGRADGSGLIYTGWNVTDTSETIGAGGGQSGGSSASVGGAAVTFSSVTSSGLLDVKNAPTSIDDMVNGTSPFGADPINFRIPTGTNDLEVWDVSFSGTFSGAITLTFNYDPTGMSLADQAALCVYHYTGGQWVAMNGSIDVASHTITVQTDSLSPFALGLAVPEPTAVSVLLLGGLAMIRHRRLRA